jgi:predicted DsbA family dithiol-disulfide isomerase
MTEHSAATLATQASRQPLTVEVWSDVVCPWCYIGKRRLESALSAFEHRDDVQVVWRSFELDPSAPRLGEPGAGEDVASYLGRKYGGGREGGLAMHERVSEIAATDGLDYHLDLAVRANTTDAHRLLHLALVEGGPEVQDRFKERLMAAYFTEGQPVDDHATLQRLADEAGLDAGRVAEVLRSDEFEADVRADVARAQAYGANGVPFTVVDGRYGVSGAQPVEVFDQALRRAWADRAPQLVQLTTPTQGASDDAAACGPDGCELPQN